MDVGKLIADAMEKLWQSVRQHLVDGVSNIPLTDEYRKWVDASMEELRQWFREATEQFCADANGFIAGVMRSRKELELSNYKECAADLALAENELAEAQRNIDSLAEEIEMYELLEDSDEYEDVIAELYEEYDAHAEQLLVAQEEVANLRADKEIALSRLQALKGA